MKRKFLSGKNWFFEEFIPSESKTSIWGFQIKKQVLLKKSKYQKIEIFETDEFGRILILDGLVQLSTTEEFIYHEMLVHPAMLYQGSPKKVLIVGGGDGGSLREVAKHKSVKEIYLVDIDKEVVNVSRKYLPSVSKGAFRDKRLKVFYEDAFKFIKKHENYFDVIINDLTDPVDPSFVPWNTEFYKDTFRALKEKGVVSFQTAYKDKENLFIKVRREIKRIFPFFKVHKAFVDCFPFDEHTFSFASKKIDFEKISLKKIKDRYQRANLKTDYYSPEMHFASQVFAKKDVNN